MSNKFVSILKKIGEDFKIGLVDVVKYLPLASELASVIFPPAVAPIDAAEVVADLISKAVAAVEQSLTAQGASSNGPTKLATVLTIVSGAVEALLAEPTIAAELKKAGITVDAAYITELINGVVAFLNLQGVTSTE